MNHSINLFLTNILLFLTIVSCSKNNDGATTDSSNSITVNVPSGAQLNKIKIQIGSYLLGASTAKPGQVVNIALSAIPMNYMNSVSADFSSTVSISDNSALTSWGHKNDISVKGFTMYGNQYDLETCTFYLSDSSNDKDVLFVFSDRAVNIKGTNTDENLWRDNYNLNLSKGWNMIYHTSAKKDTSYYYSKWVGTVYKTIYIDNYSKIDNLPSGISWHI